MLNIWVKCLAIFLLISNSYALPLLANSQQGQTGQFRNTPDYKVIKSSASCESKYDFILTSYEVIRYKSEGIAKPIINFEFPPGTELCMNKTKIDKKIKYGTTPADAKLSKYGFIKGIKILRVPLLKDDGTITKTMLNNFNKITLYVSANRPQNAIKSKESAEAILEQIDNLFLPLTQHGGKLPQFILNDIANGITPLAILTADQKLFVKEAILFEISTRENWAIIQKYGNVYDAACASTMGALFITINNKYDLDFLPMFENVEPKDYPLTHQIERALWHLGFTYADTNNYIPEKGDIGVVERFLFVEPDHTGHIFVAGVDLGLGVPDRIYDNIGYDYINTKLNYDMIGFWSIKPIEELIQR